MSACISQHGEYGSHVLNTDYTCTRCGVLAEEALIEDLHTLRIELAAAERRGMERAIQALRDGQAAAKTQRRLATEWHRDQCNCDLWPVGCVAYPVPANDPLSALDHAPDSYNIGVSAYELAVDLASLMENQSTEEGRDARD